MEQLCEAYDQNLKTYSDLHQTIYQTVPRRVFYDLLSIVRSPKFHKEGPLLKELREKKPMVYKYAMCIRHLMWIETIVRGKITRERLARKKDVVRERLERLNTPYEIMELWLKPYQKLPRGAPASKTVSYLRALDYKNANPSTSWGVLARKFCGSPRQSNTLKAWSYRMKKQLAEVGVQINLENPDYAQQRPRPESNR